MATNEDFQGVSNCYVFKSRLQEYAQKAGLPTPVYETVKEGPSHEPYFRSAVIVNNVRYDSLPGFFNRKAAEQSAAEVALVELVKSNLVNQSITQPVHETGLCKNLLQEYAQKMNYAMPVYHCKKDEVGRAQVYSCTVDIGGILYIGGTAKTKKEAEIKAARTALLAIRSSASHASQNQVGHPQLTVLPCRKRPIESVAIADENPNPLKPKRGRFKRKSSKRKPSRDKIGQIHAENVGIGADTNHEVETHANFNGESGVHEMNSENFTSESMKNVENQISVNYQEKESLAGVHEMNSENFSSESMKNVENQISVNYQEKESLTGVHEMNSENFSSESMKNVENQISVNYHEKESLAGVHEMNSENFTSESMKNVENQVSVNYHEKESLAGVHEMNSENFTSEFMKNVDNQISVNYHEKESLTGVHEMNSENFTSEFMKNVENQVSVNYHEKESLAGVHEMKSENFTSESMKNVENQISVNYHEKESLAGEGFFPVNSQEGIFENGKSTESYSKENNVGTVVAEQSSAPNEDIPEIKVEMNKQHYNGELVSSVVSEGVEA